ncbi:MAG: Nif3-like dinuclear metal center hexameric protein [Porphyromonas sp.]|nr:Nif3-like dinuclear metal center hexameric protein [Porphyromonas sp.]
MSVSIADIIRLIEQQLPPSLQESWDNCGLQLGSTELVCRGVLCTLDITEAVLEEAIRKGCNLIVAHHPLLFKGLKRIGDESYIERCVRLAIKHDITIYAAHTNADVASEGLNMLLAEELRLVNPRILAPSSSSGEGLGAIGTLPEPLKLSDCLTMLARYFDTQQMRYNLYEPQTVRSVALCGGAGAFLASEARRQGADIFVTGEAKYNDYYDAEGITLVTVGHYESEFVATRLFARIISAHYPELCHIVETPHNPVKTIN